MGVNRNLQLFDIVLMNGIGYDNWMILYIRRDDEEEEEEVEDFIWKKIHKNKFYNQLSKDLFQFHHKRNYFKTLHEEVIQIAWHPDRWWDWCLTEDEKKEIQKLWYR